MARQIKQIIVVVVSGFVSALLTCAAGAESGPLHDPSVFLFLGIVFALVFSTYAWFWEAVRSVWRITGFIGLTTAAFVIAFLVGAFEQHRIAQLTGISNPYMNGALLGGIVGTALVAIARCTFMVDGQNLKTLVVRIGIVSMVGSALGAVGVSLGPSLGAAIWHFLRLVRLIVPSPSSLGSPKAGEPELCAMFLIWQTCISPLLVLLFPRSPSSEQIPSPFTPQKTLSPLPVWKKLLVVVTFIFLAGFLVRSIRMERQTARPQVERGTVVAQAYA